MRTGSRRSEAESGWGWLVVFAAFVIHILTDGLILGCGVLLQDIRGYFDVTRNHMGWIAALLPGITYGGGVLYNGIITRWGCRPVGCLGGVITAIGILLSAFAPTFYFLYLSLGLLCGIGCGMSFMVSVVVIPQYFVKRRALAMGLSSCGSGVGAMAFAPLTRWLIDQFGWRGTLAIEGALALNMVACSLVFRPIVRPTTTNMPAPDLKPILVTLDAANENVATDLQFAKVPNDMSIHTDDESRYTQVEPCVEIQEHIEEETHRDVESRSRCCQIWEALTPSLSFSVFKDRRFALYSSATLWLCVGFGVVFAFLPDMAIERGISSGRAALLIAVIGLSNIVGRVLAGWLVDHTPLTSLHLTTAGAVGGTLAITIFPLSSLYIFLAVNSCFFGICYSAYVCLSSLVVVDLCGVDNLARNFGFCVLFAAMGYTIGSPIAGALFDATSSFTLSFLASGACMAVGSLMIMSTNFLPEPKGNNSKHVMPNHI